jgi:hypothetical protein
VPRRCGGGAAARRGRSTRQTPRRWGPWGRAGWAEAGAGGWAAAGALALAAGAAVRVSGATPPEFAAAEAIGAQSAAGLRPALLGVSDERRGAGG